MKPDLTYAVIECRTLDALALAVSQQMTKGWIPCGNLSIDTSGVNKTYLQPMIKKGE